MTASHRARALALASAAALSLVSAGMAEKHERTAEIADPLKSRSDSSMPRSTGCREECDSAAAYGTPQRTVLRLSDSCDVRITWRTRHRCTVGLDLEVLAVEPLTDGCSRLSLRRLLDEATDSLVASRATAFFTMGGLRDTCIIIGRVLRAACWRYAVACGDSIAIPCDSSSCCQSFVQLCTDEIFRRSIRTIAQTLMAPCDPRAGCTTICGSRIDSTRDDDTPDDSVDSRTDEDGELSAAEYGDGARVGGCVRNDGPAHGAARAPVRIVAQGHGAARDGVSERASNTFEELAWPWRDPRRVRHPVRDVRAREWLMARVTPVTIPMADGLATRN